MKVTIDTTDRDQMRRLFNLIFVPFRHGGLSPADLRLGLERFAGPEEPIDGRTRVTTTDGAKWARVGGWWVTPALGRTASNWEDLVDIGIEHIGGVRE